MTTSLDPDTTPTAPVTRSDSGEHDTTTAPDDSRLPVRAKPDAPQRNAADDAEPRVRTASVEQILRTVT